VQKTTRENLVVTKTVSSVSKKSHIITAHCSKSLKNVHKFILRELSREIEYLNFRAKNAIYIQSKSRFLARKLIFFPHFIYSFLARKFKFEQNLKLNLWTQN